MMRFLSALSTPLSAHQPTPRAWVYWLAGLLILAGLGLAAVILPPLVLLILIAAMVGLGVVSARPQWALAALLLLRSSADRMQSLFTLAPIGGITFNATGLFNVLGLALGILFLARRFARGQSWLPGIPLKAFGLLLLIAALGLPGSISPVASLKEWSRLAGSLGVALLVLEVVYGNGNQSMESKLCWLLRVITLAALPPLAVGYYEAATGGGYFFLGAVGTSFAYRPEGTFGHPAILGTFLILVVVLAISGFINRHPAWPRLIWLGLALASLGLLVLTYARTEWLGGLAALGVIGLLRYRRLLLMGLVMALVLVLAVPSVRNRLQGEQSSVSVNWRFKVWHASLSILQKPTWLGSGLDTSPILINKVLYNVTEPPHNDYLMAGIEMGVFGLLALIGLQLSLLVFNLRVYMRPAVPSAGMLAMAMLAMTVAGVVINLSDNYLSYTSYQWYFWSLIGALIGLQAMRKSHLESAPAPEEFVGRME